MRTVQILEPEDLVEPTDWCRPLQITSMSGGLSDDYAFEAMYTGTPQNNAKWVRIADVFGPVWFGRPVKELTQVEPYEVVRGDVPEHHRLKGHVSLADMLVGLEER